jgi:hypothetical protein
MKKLFSVFVFFLFICFTVSAQSKKAVENPTVNYKILDIPKNAQSETKFSASSTVGLIKRSFKSPKANFVLYFDKKGKISFAGIQEVGNSGMNPQTTGLIGFLSCCAAGFDANGDPATIVISCASAHLNLQLQVAQEKQ